MHGGGREGVPGAWSGVGADDADRRVEGLGDWAGGAFSLGGDGPQHTGGITQIKFSKDGMLLFSGMADIYKIIFSC